jgi:hypothetical protein
LPVNRLARGSSSTWYACGRYDESRSPYVYLMLVGFHSPKPAIKRLVEQRGA